jgi:hypothetical protein
MAISNCLFSPTSENPPTPRRGRSDFKFGVYLPAAGRLAKLSANPPAYGSQAQLLIAETVGNTMKEKTFST